MACWNAEPVNSGGAILGLDTPSPANRAIWVSRAVSGRLLMVRSRPAPRTAACGPQHHPAPRRLIPAIVELAPRPAHPWRPDPHAGVPARDPTDANAFLAGSGLRQGRHVRTRHR